MAAVFVSQVQSGEELAQDIITIHNNDAFGKMEPVMVQTFVHKVTAFHKGTLVKLIDDSVGEIVFSDHANPTRPWVKCERENH